MSQSSNKLPGVKVVVVVLPLVEWIPRDRWKSAIEQCALFTKMLGVVCVMRSPKELRFIGWHCRGQSQPERWWQRRWLKISNQRIAFAPLVLEVWASPQKVFCVSFFSSTVGALPVAVFSDRGKPRVRPCIELHNCSQPTCVIGSTLFQRSDG